MTKILFVLIIGLLFEAVGVVFLSAGLKQIGELQQVTLAEIGRLVARGAVNRNILLGIFFEAIFFGCLLYLLSQRDVSLIWPLTSLGFVITAIAAKIILKEEVSALRWAGVALIVVGAALVSYSEKAKSKPADAIPAAQTPTAAR
ncbi:MAG: EamA family transporter [Verrucomicrobia bacterium]|nr:EamA family transporter [Verrucomicrobiota bacterium]